MKAAWAGSGLDGLLDAIDRVERKLLGSRPERFLRVVSIDPGTVTGVAVYWAQWSVRAGGLWKVTAWAETLLAHDENVQVGSLLAVVERVVRHGHTDVVVEDFVVRRVAMEKTFLSPVRIGRKVEWGLIERAPAWLYGVALQWVSSSEMAAMRDPRLKALGHYTPGPDHRRDATRHALLHLRSLSVSGESRTGKRNSVAPLVLKSRNKPVWPVEWGVVRGVGGMRLISQK